MQIRPEIGRASEVQLPILREEGDRMNRELKPCPFCGSEAHIEKVRVRVHRGTEDDENEFDVRNRLF